MGLLDYGQVREPSDVVKKHRRLLDMVQPVQSQPQKNAETAFGDYYAKLAQDNPDRDKTLMSEGILALHKGGRVPNRMPSVDELEAFGRESIASRKPQPPEQGYLETIGKGMVRGTERMAGGINEMARWGIESAGMIPGFSQAIRGMVGQENLDRMAQPFKEGAAYWNKAAESGWAQADPQTFSGTFFENPSLKRALGIVSEAVPSLGAALLTGGATGVPAAGAIMLGLLEGAPMYGEAREAGKGIDESSFYAGIASAGTALLEYLPIDTILKFSGGTLMGAARGFLAEGVQESVQQFWQNLVAKYGYDTTRSLAEGIVESFIGGAGSGAIMGGTVAKLNHAQQQGVSKDDFFKASKDLEKQLTDFAAQEQTRRDETRKTSDFLNIVRQNLVRGQDEKGRPFNLEHVEDYLQVAQAEDPFSDEADGLRKIIIDYRQAPRSNLRSGAILMEGEQAPVPVPEPASEPGVTAEDVPFAGRWAENIGRKLVRRDRTRSGATLLEGEEPEQRPSSRKTGRADTEDIPYTGRWTEGIEARRAQEAEAADQEQWLHGRMSGLMQWIKESQGPGQRVQRDDGSWWGWNTMYEPWFRDIMGRHKVGRDEVFKAVEKGIAGESLGPRQSQIYDEFRDAAAHHHEVLDGPDEETLAQRRESRAKEELRNMSDEQVAEITSYLEGNPEFEDLHTWAKDEQTYRAAFEGESGRDKRLDIDERQLTDEAIEKMAPEQAKEYLKAVRDRSMQQYIEARTDQLTGTRNRRAYDDFIANQEAAIAEGRQENTRTQAFIDMDDFKWVNDNLGHEHGDQLLKALADAARDEDLPDMFRYGGDEFIALAPEGLSDDEFRGKVEALRDRLKEATVKVQLPDGTIVGKKGLGFSIGIGATKEIADAEVYRDKESRLQEGLRAGRAGAEPPGVFRESPQGVEDRGRGPAAEEIPEAEPKPEIIPPEVGAQADFKPEKSAKSSKSEQQETIKTGPSDNLVQWVSEKLRVKESFTWRELFSAADDAFGGTQAEGRYSVKDAYDAMEVGINQVIRDNGFGFSNPENVVKQLRELMDRVPTQTKRTEEQDEFQQFSTPPTLAFAAAWAGNVRQSDTVLEPSAGTGNLAVWAQNAGADQVIVNELSPRRVELLQLQNFDRVFTENAEQLNNILPKDIVPSLVIMNPPFSSTAGRKTGTRDNMNGAIHVEQALKRLAPGGRLVAIVGRGMADNRPNMRKWWKKIKEEYNVLANVGISGNEYKKYGTSFDNQLLIIDKSGKTVDNIITSKVDSIENLFPLLKGVRNARQQARTSPETGEQPSTQSTSTEASTGPESPRGSQPSLLPPTYTGTTGQREGSNGPESGGPSGTNAGVSTSGRSEPGGKVPRPKRTGSKRKPGKTGAKDTGRTGQSNVRDREGVSKAPGDLKVGDNVSVEDIDAVLDLALGPEEKPAEEKTAGKLLKKSAKEALKATDEALKGLSDLFTPKNTLAAAGLAFDKETYAKAKPHFEAAWAHAKEAGMSLVDFVKYVAERFDASIRPYLRQFMIEKTQEEAGEAETEEKATAVEFEAAREDEERGEISDSVYERYRSQVHIKGAQPHPTPLVESAAMASVDAPAASYTPNLPASAIQNGKVSDIQIEAVVRAGQAHEQELPNGERRGFFIGDGTGVGKGREISAIIWDNWNQGRKKAIWISENNDLVKDAKRDLQGVGWKKGAEKCFPLGKTKLGEPIKASEGVLFTAYSTVAGRGKGSYENVRFDKPETLKNLGIRINQIVNWVGQDFDGVIAFDESHNMSNSLAQEGAMGMKTTPAGKALAGILLQKLLPKARVVYVSATGATEVSNLLYASRLGLWGEGTAFTDQGAFISNIAKGGLAAMEMVAQNMKAMGSYLARSLSYHDVKYRRLEHNLDEYQRKLYDFLAEAWQTVLENVNEAIDVTNASGRARAAAMSAFWGSHQRFFNQIITSMQIPSVLKAVEQDLKNGNAVVLQLVNTNEAQLGRALARMQEGDELEDLDLSPKDQLIEYVRKSFPVDQYEEYIDEDGNERVRPVVDSEGKPVQNAEAVAMREALIDRLASVKAPEGPLDMLINHFGKDKVAEITGRSQRVVFDPEKGKKIIENWSKPKGNADVDAFMKGEKQTLVFSDAGGTGRSFHADMTALNQNKRIHYLVQPGWSATKAVQGFGRTHRSNQRQAPEYVLVTTDLKGQMRFISSIARRLDQLGALTKGQRQTGSQGIFQARDNLESEYARIALRQLFEDLQYDRLKSGGTDSKFTPVEMDGEEFEKQTGLKLFDKDGNPISGDLPPMKSFLNRLLSMKIEGQNTIFEAFSERLDAVVQHHADMGTLDTGMETIRGKSIEKAKSETVYTDPRTGAETKYVALDVTNEAVLLDFKDSKRFSEAGYYRNLRSGKIWAASRQRDRTNKQGRIVTFRTLVNPGNTRQNVEIERLDDAGKWKKVPDAEAQTHWESDYETYPREVTSRRHLITGALLPIWDRLAGSPKILRAQTDQGERLLGREIESVHLDAVLENLGVGVERVERSGKELQQKIIDHGFTIRLVNGWRIVKAQVSGDDRIEIKGPGYGDDALLRKHGILTERIQFQLRYFVPTDEKGAVLLDWLVKDKPIVAEEAPYTGERLGQFSTGPAVPGKAVSLDEIKEIFKGQAVGVNKEGSVWVRTGRGLGVEIRQVEQIAEDRVAFQVGYGRMKETDEALAGKYQNGVIEFSRAAGDTWTLRHEQVHWLEDVGLLSSMDVSLLRSHIRGLHKQGKWTTANEKDVGGAEDRATFIADRLHGQVPTGYVQRIFTKIREFIDRFVNLFQRTAGGVVRDVESGRVHKKGIPFKSSSRSGFLTATPAYSVQANPDRLKQVLDDEVKASVRAMAGAVKGMDRHGLLGQIVATQEWDQTPIGKALADAATTGREERKHQIFNKVLNNDQGVVVSDFLKAMKLEGANLTQRFKGYDLYSRDDDKLPKDYRQVKDALTYMDENEVRWWDYKGKKGYRSKLEEQGVSDQVIEAVDHFRRSMDNALDLMRGQLSEIIAAYEAAGEAIPVIATRKTKKGKTENITLKDAYLEMGQMRGFYAPRVRESGDWHVLSLDSEGTAYRYGTPSRRQAHKLAIQLQREGHTDVRVERVERLPESIYQDLSIGKVSQALEQAAASMKDVDPDTRAKVRMELVEAAADMMKSRAFRAHRIARSGRKGDVVKGYIEDPLTRFLLYNHRIAGGIAKGEAAMKMFEAVQGRYVPYERDGDQWVYRSKDGEIIDSKPMSDEDKASKDKTKVFKHGGVDSAKQPERYNQYLKYITEQLRNPDRFDRAINLGKAIVSFKYLGFNPRSALVNTTAMLTTAPSAIHQYAVDGKVGLTRIGRELSKASVDYVKVMRGKKLSDADEQAFMDHIKESGYDSPQLTREAMSMLQSGYGRSWEKIMSGSMWLFGTTEQWNRGVTMLAAYRLAREQGQNHKKAMKAAKLASDRAHGIYGKGTLPSWAQGQNPAAKIAQMGYTYSKFGHNYLQMLHDLGFNKKNYKALAFALASPAVVGGAASSLIYSSVMTLVNAIMRAVGDDRDPEKMVADVIRENLGDVAERTFRFGIMGAAGVDLSSSLAVGMEIPTTLLDLTGPFGGVYEDLAKAAHYLKTGQPGRAAERALPTALANFPRALRELEGATTSRGNRIWDEQGKPYVPSAAETVTRLVGFRSSRRATVQERQWEGKKELARFAERRSNIYERFRAHLARKGSREDWQKILDDIADYNASVINSGRRGLVPLITKQSLKGQAKRFVRPTRRERALMEG